MLEFPQSSQDHPGQAALFSESSILVADDSEIFLRKVVFLLQKEGYSTSTTASGRALFQEVKARQPSLVVLAEDLPDISGLKVCQMLQLDPLTEHIPIIVTTKKAEEFEIVDERLAFLSKPLDTKAFLSAINQLLYPLPKAQDFVSLIEATGIVRWETSVRSADREELVLERKNWRPEMEALFGVEGDCLVEYIAADRTVVKYQAVLSSIEEDVVHAKLKGPLERVQQRKYLRRPVQLRVRYRLPGEFYRLTRTLDLSGGGARLVEVPTTLKIGDLFEISMFLPSLPGREFKLRSELRWGRPFNPFRQEAGVSFIESSWGERKAIIDFLFGGS